MKELLNKELLPQNGVGTGGFSNWRDKLGIVEKDPAVQLLEDYEAVLQYGEAISFDEFVRREA